MSILIPAPRTRSMERSYTGRPSLSWGAQPTASATPHTLGNKTEIIAATAYETTWIVVMVTDTASNNVNTDSLVNIYTGGAGSEVVLIPNLLSGWAKAMTLGHRRYEFPLRVPRGTRLSCGMQALIASDNCRVQIELEARDAWAGSGVECIGAVTASSRGTTVTPGTSAEGSFASIGTSTRAYRYVFATLAGNADTSAAAVQQGIDVGTGGAPIAGLENFIIYQGTDEFQEPHDSGRYVEIPSGTALQARIQSSSTDAEAKSVCIYGVY